MPESTTTAVTTAELCQCGHQKVDHSPIAVRYCAATVSNALSRGCICYPLPALAAGLFARERTPAGLSTRGRTPAEPPAPGPERA